MLISAAVALVLFAAPETTQSGETAAPPPAAESAPAAAEAKPAMRKVCAEVEVSGSRLPKKKCRMEPVKGEPKQEAAKTPAANPAS